MTTNDYKKRKDTNIFKSFVVRRKNGLTQKTNFTEFWKMYGKTFAEASKKFDDGILYNEPAKPKNINVAGQKNAFELLYNSLPDRDKKRL